MHQTQRFPNVGAAGEPRAMLPAWIAGATLLVAAPCVVLALQPALVRSLMSFMGGAASVSRNPSWILPALAVGVVIGSAVLALVALAAFARGVQDSPYVCLSPVLVGFSATVLAGSNATIPLQGLSAALFAPAAALLLIGGGALIQLRGWRSKIAGTLVVVLPLLALLAAHAHAAGDARGVWNSLDTSARLFLFVLTLTSCGVVLVAFVARPALVDSDPMNLMQGWRQQRKQLADVMERLRLSELDLVETEQRAKAAEQRLHAQRLAHVDGARFDQDDADAHDFAALARPGFSPLLLATFGVLLGTGIAAIAYFGAYAPLQRRIAQQHAAMQVTTQHRAAEIEALRRQFQAQQESLDATLASERARASQAIQALEQARAAAAVAIVEPVTTAETVKPTQAKSAVRARAAAKHRSATKRAAARTKQHAAVRTEQVNQEPAFDRETRRALRDSASNDPIGGLEGM